MRHQARQAAPYLMGAVGAAAIAVMVVVSWLRSSSEEEELQAGRALCVGRAQRDEVKYIPTGR